MLMQRTDSTTRMLILIVSIMEVIQTQGTILTHTIALAIPKIRTRSHARKASAYSSPL
jgi:hypothetical protein